MTEFTITVLTSEITEQSDLISNQLTILATDLPILITKLELKIQSYQNIVNIHCEEYSGLNGLISIYNIAEQQIMNGKLSPSPVNSFTLHVPSGNYLVRVINKNSVYNGKVYIMSK